MPDPKYEFTAAAGVLLNIFSAVCPDSDFIINTEVNTIEELPWLENNEFSSIKDYLLNLRNGLAHKTEDNFQDYQHDDQIAQLQINSQNGERYRFSITELEKIIRWFENKIEQEL